MAMQVNFLSNSCIRCWYDKRMPVLANVADMAQERLVQDAVDCVLVISTAAWLPFHCSLV